MFPRVNWGAPFRNLASSLGNGIARVGDAVNLPEMGMSEKFGSTYVQTSGQPTSRSGLISLVDDTGLTQVPRTTLVEARTQGNDQNSTDNSGITQNGGSGRSGGGSRSFDPTAVWEAQDALDQANQYLGLIPQQQAMFNTNLMNTYNKYRQNMQQDYGRNEQNYNTNRTQTMQDNERAKSQIDQKVRARSNSLQRLLGSYGAGDSEAAQFLAPYAAARTGTQLRQQVNNQYSRNLGGLDSSWNQYRTDYDNSLNDLNDQQENERRQKEQEFLQKQFDLTDQRRKAEAALRYAQGGNADESRALRNQALPALYQLLQQINALGATKVTPTANDARYAAPDLQDYTTEGAQDVQGVQSNVADAVSPLYQWMLKKQQEDQNFYGY